VFAPPTPADALQLVVDVPLEALRFLDLSLEFARLLSELLRTSFRHRAEITSNRNT
jgi:hypothetical protein